MSDAMIRIEMAVLGTIMAESHRAPEWVPTIGLDMFQDPDCVDLARAIIENHRSGKPVNPDSILLVLEGRKSCPIDRLGLDAFFDAAVVRDSDFTDNIQNLQDARDQRRRITLAVCIKEAAEAGKDAAELIQELQAVGSEQASAKHGFSLVRVSDMEIREPDFLVDEFIETDTLCSLFGDPEAGKSFVALSLACAVAAGVPWFGNCTKQSPVIYIAGEGLSGLKRRVLAWQAGNGVTHEFPLFFSTVAARVTDDAHIQQVIRVIERIAEKHGTPGLIVLDTLARNFGGQDENATADMNRFVFGCDSLRSRFKAAVLTNHHCGHGDKGRGRGNTAFKAALDREYIVDRDSDVVRVSCTKLKDGLRPDDRYFCFTDCVVGRGASGKEITSAYLLPTEPAAFETTKKGPVQKQAVSVLAAMYAERQSNLTARGYPPESAAVSLGEFKEAMAKAGIDRRRIPELLDNQKLFKIQNGKVRHV